MSSNVGGTISGVLINTTVGGGGGGHMHSWPYTTTPQPATGITQLSDADVERVAARVVQMLRTTPEAIDELIEWRKQHIG